MLINLAKNFIRNGILIGILFMRQEPNMKAAEGAGLTMDNIDFEFMTRDDPIVKVKDTAGRFQQNLTPEEINEMAELAPYAEKFMLLTVKGETGKIPSEEDVNQLLQQTTQEMASKTEQGMPSEQGSGTMVPQDMQSEAMAPSRPVEDKMLENAAVPADGGAPIDRMMSRGGKVGLEAAKDIVKEKYPVQAKHLDDLNVVFVPNMSGHSEYLSPLYDDSKKYNNEATIEINPKYSKTPEEIASAIAGETLHHMKDFDDGFRSMWKSLRQKVDKDDVFKNVQRKRQRTINTMRQGEYIRGMAQDPRGKKSPYDDTRDVDKFIDNSALDEYIRAYNFYDDPIAGEHYDEGWKNDQFFKKYKSEFEGFKKYLNPPKFMGMALGGVAAGPIGVVDKPGADNSGVADDVPAESDGFIINAAAVRHAGLRDINDMIQDAKKYAEKQGMKLNFGKTPTDAEQILVSNGEVVIPDVIANIIGYDRLEKINNRGKKETEEKIANQEQQQPAQPVMQAAEGGEVFPAEDAMVRQETLKTLTPFLDEQMLNNVGMDKIKEIYSLYWNPETKAKTQGGNRRDYNNPKGVWMTHLQDSTEHELQPGIPEAIREIMPAFDSELKSLKIYDPELFEYFAKIESKGGKGLINKKSKDYGAFQINMNNVSKYFKDDNQFKNFAKFYGKKAAAVTGVSAYKLREIYNNNPKEFQQLMTDDPKTNLAVGLAITLLPNMWNTRDK